MAKVGQIERAVEVAEMIDEPVARLQALAAIIAVKREAEKKKERGVREANILGCQLRVRRQ